MRNLVSSALVSVGLLVPAAAAAVPATQSVAPASASVKIIRALTIDCTAMEFGQIAPLPNASAIVTVPAQGGPITDNSNVVVPGSRTSATPANCTVDGEHNATYTVSLPQAPTTLTGNGNPMPLGTFTISEQADGMPYDRKLSNLRSSGPSAGGGFDGFGVGATLTVGSQQAPGEYTGTFLVSVQYN